MHLCEKMATLRGVQLSSQMNGTNHPAGGAPVPDRTEDFERLIGAIQQGDREAEQAVVLHFMRPVKAMLLARLRSPDAASDLLQDIMIELISALRRGQVRDPSKLPGFVAGISRNVLNNHFRGSARQPESLEFPDALPDLMGSGNGFEDGQRENQALSAISSLDSVDRQILQMTLVDGLKPGVIAEKLGLDPNVVRQRKLRATRRVINLVQSPSQNASGIHLLTRRRV
jgi:RNA polymerase sigma factor (sigma-70 family)